MNNKSAERAQFIKGCVAFPHLRTEHQAKDVFQFPFALFGKNISYITRRCDAAVKPDFLKIINYNGRGDKFNLLEAFAVGLACSKYQYAVLFHISYVTFVIAILTKIFSFFRVGKVTKVILQSDFAPKYQETYERRNTGMLRIAFFIARKMTPFLFDAVSVASDKGQRFLIDAIGIPKEKVFKVYNCPYFESYPDESITASILRKNKILFIGRKDDPQKNTKAVIEAFEAVVRIHPNWILKLVGPGKLYYSSLNEISIFQPGAIVNRKLISNICHESKIFLMPSLPQEGASLAFVEALTSGCYPVCTDVGNFAELIEKIGEGVIVSTESSSIVEGLIKAIGKVEYNASVNKNISRSADFLKWDIQVKDIKEYLCLS